jgi:hypothetical protein
MNLVATLRLAFNPGDNNPKVVFPACILLFIGIFIDHLIPGVKLKTSLIAGSVGFQNWI